MSDNPANNKNVRDDEIDLLDLFRRMGITINNWVRGLGKAFLISVVFLVRRWLPLGLSIVLGIVLSYFLRIASESSYSSDLVLKTNATSTDEMIFYLNRLHTFCMEGNSVALANAISAQPLQVKNIIDISAYWIIDEGKDGIPDMVDYKGNHNIYDTVNVRMKDRLDLRVRIKSPQELENVRNGILKFINSDSLFQQRNRVRLRQNKELLSRLNSDILQLDSLQKVKYFEETRSRLPSGGGQMIFLQEQKTQLIYNDTYTLYARKQGLETERDLYKDIVTVLSEFSIPANRENGSMYYAMKLTPALFLITLLALIIIANIKRLKEVYNKY